MTDIELSQLKTVLVHEIGHDVYTIFAEIKSKLIYITEDVASCEGVWGPIDNVAPYLRPLESMTKREYYEHEIERKRVDIEDYVCEFYDTPESVLWLLQNHFDYFGLIEKGLAIEK